MSCGGGQSTERGRDFQHIPPKVKKQQHVYSVVKVCVCMYVCVLMNVCVCMPFTIHSIDI